MGDLKPVILLAIILIFAYVIYNCQRNKNPNEPFSPNNEDAASNIVLQDNPVDITCQNGIPGSKAMEAGQYFAQNDYAPPESDWLKSKFNGRNKARGDYKASSYSSARRGELGPSDWGTYFDQNNTIIGAGESGDNDKFLPVDESGTGFAAYKSTGNATCGSNQNCDPEDLFNNEHYLPQEVNDDWFEVAPEPISVKNRHLINITKPIGINTIGSSLKNASYDIRGTPMCPKFVVSPWLGSSIEPDNNLKPLM